MRSSQLHVPHVGLAVQEEAISDVQQPSSEHHEGPTERDERADDRPNVVALNAQLDRMRIAMAAARYLMPYIVTYAKNLAKIPGNAVAAVDAMQHVNTFREFDDEGKTVPDHRFPGGKQP